MTQGMCIKRLYTDVLQVGSRSVLAYLHHDHCSPGRHAGLTGRERPKWWGHQKHPHHQMHWAAWGGPCAAAVGSAAAWAERGGSVAKWWGPARPALTQAVQPHGGRVQPWLQAARLPSPFVEAHLVLACWARGVQLQHQTLCEHAHNATQR